MGDVTYLPDRLTPEQALDEAKENDYREVLIVGTTRDNCIKFCNSHMTRRDALWLAHEMIKYATGD